MSLKSIGNERSKGAVTRSIDQFKLSPTHFFKNLAHFVVFLPWRGNYKINNKDYRINKERLEEKS